MHSSSFRLLAVVVGLVAIPARLNAAPGPADKPPPKAPATFPPDVEAYRNARQRQRDAAIGRVREEIAAAQRKIKELTKRRRMNLRKDKAAAHRAAEEIRKLEEEIIPKLQKQLVGLRENRPPFRATMNPLRLHVRDAGDLKPPDCWSWEIRILDIMGKDEMLVQPRYRNKVFSGSGGVLTVRRGPENSGPILSIKGVPTAGKTDGSPVKLGGPFFVSGTKRYETVGGGSNTVLVLEPIKLPHHLPWKDN